MQHAAENDHPGEVLLVLVSCPAEKDEEIALALIESRLAACVNIIPRMKSIYHWQGKVQQDHESMLLIKCSTDNYPALQERILEIHPYELPEIIAVSISGGLPAYLAWISQPIENNSE